jgi:hypothetical protein
MVHPLLGERAGVRGIPLYIKHYRFMESFEDNQKGISHKATKTTKGATAFRLPLFFVFFVSFC